MIWILTQNYRLLTSLFIKIPFVIFLVKTMVYIKANKSQICHLKNNYRGDTFKILDAITNCLSFSIFCDLIFTPISPFFYFLQFDFSRRNPGIACYSLLWKFTSKFNLKGKTITILLPRKSCSFSDHRFSSIDLCPNSVVTFIFLFLALTCLVANIQMPWTKKNLLSTQSI